MLSPRQQLQSVLDATVFRKQPIRLLEAGCGSSSNIDIPQCADVIGIDISQEELDKNTTVSEKICGDIQTHELPSEAFDLIMCWDVLEHVPRPEDAMERFVAAAKPEGYILLAFPNVQSLKGIVTKLTPFAFHRWFYRITYGKERATTDGVMPFPTYLSWNISIRNVERFAERHGLQTEFSAIIESGLQRRFRNRVHLTGYLAEWVDGLVKVLSLGTVNLFKSDCIFLFKKP